MSDRELPATARAVGDRPPAPVRWIGRAQTWLVARAPWAWRLIRRPTRRFFDRVAPHWDERVQPDAPERVATLEAALEHVDLAPERILDVGTGTGAAALMFARRFSDAEVWGVDLSEAMIESARAKVGDDIAPRVRFSVADAAALPFADASFDVVVQVSVPAFFDEIARVLRPGGYVVVVSSIGSATPYHTPRAVLRERFARRGVHEVGRGEAGSGSYFVARRSS